MSLELDERQWAMLAEFGIRFGQPPGGAPARARREAPRVSAPVPDAPAARPAEPEAAVPATAQPVPITSLVGASVDSLGWDALAQAVAGCQACGLCVGRRHAIAGSGDPQAQWLVVGDPPTEADDVQGEPFVGTEGKLLGNMLRSLGLARDRGVYLSNVLRCRPPGNRNPEPDELARCEPFLRRQVALLQPRIILAMGRFAVQSLLGTTEPIGKLRGRVHVYQGVPVVVTYHPGYLLRNPADKGKAWADLCLALGVLER